MTMSSPKKIKTYGKNKQAIKGVMHVLTSLLKKENANISVCVYSGMSLPDIYNNRPKINDITSFIVICSAPCHRMLNETHVFSGALFLREEMSVFQIEKALKNWIFSPVKGSKVKINAIEREILKHFINEKQIKEIAYLLGCNQKTLYSRIDLLSKRMGTHSKQELYFKARILLNDEQNYIKDVN
ncbi:helix-turn-helix transcriptional regulator [Enterobacter hormaechei]